ncbi:MAG: CHAT domain-containing protein [Deltaproteobacteria bacterium]|nr:CHAT domain-containing protein [Deltaproteobacteria bacterium]
MKYEDFVLQLERHDNSRFQARVLQSPAGEGSAVFDLDLSEFTDSNLLLMEQEPTRKGTPALLEEPVLQRHVEAVLPSTASRRSPEEVGANLFEAAVVGQVRSLLDQSLGGLRKSADGGLRIKLKIDPSDRTLAALGALPWELLRRQETDDFLCLQRQSPVVRYLDVPRPVERRPLPRPTKVLVAISSPSDLPPLKLLTEERSLRRLRGRQANVKFQVIEKATAASIRSALVEGGFHALHFMGHGDFDPASGEGVLYFENESGRAEPTSGRALATKLKDFPDLRMVVLNACNTARHSQRRGQSPFSGVATALVLGGLPAVVAMQAPIADDAAIHFSQKLYQRLAAGDALDLALTEARQALHSLRPSSAEWAVPVLYLRVPDGNLFDSEDSSRRGARWRRRGQIATLATILTLGTVGLSPSLRSAAFQAFLPGPSFEQRGEVLLLDLGQGFASAIGSFKGKIARVELMKDGRMRFFFEFENEADHETDLSFDLGRTYAADEYGNRYGVLDYGDQKGSKENDSAAVAAHGKVTKWLEFPGPLDQAHLLKVGLVSQQKDVTFPLLPVKLPQYPADYSRVTPEPEILPESHSLEVPQQELNSDIDGFLGRVQAIRLLPAGRMRWQISFFNGSDADHSLSFHYDRMYIADEFGNRYPVVGSNTGAFAGSKTNAYSSLVQREVRLDAWFEFPAPVAGAKSFRLVMAGDGDVGPRFDDYQVQLPDVPDSFSIEPLDKDLANGAQRLRLEQQFTSTLNGLTGTVEGIDWLENGSMRWRLSFFNRSARDLELALDLKSSFLQDDLGRRLQVRRGSTGRGKSKGDAERVQRGVRTSRWLEFPAPHPGSRTFIVALSMKADIEVSFPPFNVGPIAVKNPQKKVERVPEKPAPSASSAPPNPGVRTKEVPVVRWSIEEGEVALRSTLPDLEGKISGFLSLGDGRLRVEGEFQNVGSVPLSFRFQPGDSSLSAGDGTRYRILDGNTLTSDSSLDPGGNVEWWLEFPAPKPGSRRFLLVVGGDASVGIRFLPLFVELAPPPND